MKNKPNIILISIDTLGAKHLSCYGYNRKTTPFLDDISKKGILLEKMTTPSPTTLPAHTSVFTSLYPAWNEAGIFNMNKVNHENKESFWTNILNKMSIDTGSFVSSIVLDKRFTDKFGFKYYDDEMTCSELNRPKSLRRRSEETFKRAIDWIRNREKTFFLFIHLMDCHGTYDVDKTIAKKYVKEKYEKEKVLHLKKDLRKNSIPKIYSLSKLDDFPGKHYGQYYLDKYDGCIRYVDQSIKEFVKKVKTETDRDTIFIVFGDHGEEFGENDYWCMHSHGTVKNQVHVPFIMWGPGLKNKRLDKKSVFSLKDIGPTILDLFGINDCFGHGKSIFNNNEEIVFSHGFSQAAAITNKGALMVGRTTETDDILKWNFDVNNESKFFWNQKSNIDENNIRPKLRLFLDASKIANRFIKRSHYSEKQKKYKLILEKMVALGYSYEIDGEIKKKKDENKLKEGLTPLKNQEEYLISRGDFKKITNKLNIKKKGFNLQKKLKKDNRKLTFFKIV